MGASKATSTVHPTTPQQPFSDWSPTRSTPLTQAPDSEFVYFAQGIHSSNYPASLQASNLCPPLDPPSSPTVTVSTEAELREQAYSTASGTTILVSPGIYNLTDAIHVINDGITIRSSTGNPEACYFPNYRPADDWGGGAWVQTSTKRGILISGRKGLGDNCYGIPGETCGPDACDPYKGYHAYPYEPQILFYDPQELVEAIAGTKQPWEIVPYAIYTLTSEVLDHECATLGAAAYDQDRRILYVTEQEAGPWGETVVHVWQVA